MLRILVKILIDCLSDPFVVFNVKLRSFSSGVEN